MDLRPTVRFKLDDFVIKQSKRLKIDFVPTRAYDTDAGADIRCVLGFTLQPHNTVKISTGVHVELPPNTKCEVKSKSGLWVEHGIITTGLVDEGYDGMIRVRLANLSEEPHIFKPGDKIAQLVISPVLYPTYEQAQSIRAGDRGSHGFGSTGR